MRAGIPGPDADTEGEERGRTRTNTDQHGRTRVVESMVGAGLERNGEWEGVVGQSMRRSQSQNL